MIFQLEKWCDEYIDDVAYYANNINIANNLRNAFPFPYTKSNAEWYVNDCIENEGLTQCTRAIVVDNHAIGSIGVFFKNDVACKTAEIGYWLAEDYWNKGIMSKAIGKICEMVFSNYDIIRIFAEPFSYNIGSRKALENSGFLLEGILKYSVYKNNVVYDSCMYALIRS